MRNKGPIRGSLSVRFWTNVSGSSTLRRIGNELEFNNRLVTVESQEWGLTGWVQGVGARGWINIRPVIKDAGKARFYGEFMLFFGLDFS